MVVGKYRDICERKHVRDEAHWRAHKYEWKEVRNMARARAPGRGMGVTEGFVGGRGGGTSGAAQAGTDSGPNSVVPNIPTSTPHLLRILITVIAQDSI